MRDECKTNSLPFNAYKSALIENYFRSGNAPLSSEGLSDIFSKNKDLVLEKDVVNNQTLLHLAVLVNQIEWVRALIASGADVNAVASSESVLLYAISVNNDSIIQLLLNNNAIAYFQHETNSRSEITKVITRGVSISPAVVSQMLTRVPHYQKLYDLGVQGKTNELKQLLQEFPTKRETPVLNESPDFLTNLSDVQTLEDILRSLFMMLFNQHKFDGASVISEKLREIAEFKIQNFNPESDVDYRENLIWWEYKTKYVFLESGSVNQNKQIQIFFDGIVTLLGNADRCVVLLDQLDKKLAGAYPNLDSVKPGEGIEAANNFRFPSRPSESHAFIKTNSALTYFIFEKLRQHKICLSEDVLTFVGFVDSTVANRKISEGFLFKDHWAVAQGIIHGKYTHLLHFYLIVRAIECEDVRLPENMTLQDIMKIMVANKVTPSGDPLWMDLLDYSSCAESQTKAQDYNFGNVHRLNSFMWFCDALPHLRGAWLNSFYKSTNKLQLIVKEKFGVAPSYELLAYAQSLSYAIFDLFNLGVEKKDVESWLQRKNTSTKFDLGSGIVCKKLPTLFQPAANSADSGASVHLSL